MPQMHADNMLILIRGKRLSLAGRNSIVARAYTARVSKECPINFAVCAISMPISNGSNTVCADLTSSAILAALNHSRPDTN